MKSNPFHLPPLIVKIILAVLVLSIAFLALAFLGGDPPSMRGFYYAIWLAFAGVLWKNRDGLAVRFTRLHLPEFAIFIGLGLGMILLEETIAGVVVHLLRIQNAGELLAIVPQYYANNLLLLPGFIIAWYILLKFFAYTRAEVFALVGLFGLFSEKIYIHVLNVPVMGIALILPTMFTYMGIIMPSVLAIRSTGNRHLIWPLKVFFGFVFPIIVSIPFVFVHTLLTNAGLIDPTILTR